MKLKTLFMTAAMLFGAISANAAVDENFYIFLCFGPRISPARDRASS